MIHNRKFFIETTVMICLLFGCIRLNPGEITPPSVFTTMPTTTDIPLLSPTATTEPFPGNEVIIPSILDRPLNYPKAFLNGETILMASMGILAMHPDSGETVKLDDALGAEFLNSSGTSPLSPDGKWIAYAIDRRQLILLETSTSIRYSYKFPGLIQSLAWMPDSRHLLLNVVGGEPYQVRPLWLFYFDIQTNVYTILQDKFGSKIEDLSPDAKSFVYFDPKYVENNTTPVSVALGFISGDPPIQLTSNDLHIFWADVTPDGQKLAVFASDPAFPYNPVKDFPCFSPLNKAYLLNLRTKERQDYSIKGKNAVSSVRLSPDGKKIVYANAEGRLCSENFPIYILNLESGLNERLKVGGLEVGWSPDGSKLAIVHIDAGSQGPRRQIIIYDLLSKLILNTFYNTDIDKEGATLFWVTVNSSARQQ